MSRTAIEAVLTGEITSHTHPAGAGGLNQSQVQALIDASVTAARQADHPVGSYYFSEAATAPADVFGFGTWARVEGRFIVGASDSDGDFDVGDQAGAKTVTLAETQIPSHTHVQNSHTHVQDAHTHVENQNSATTGGLAGWAARDTSTSTPVATGYSTAAATAVNQVATAVNQSTGGGQAHDNLPPFRAADIWRRTA
jgi:microcystin-dependent protein